MSQQLKLAALLALAPFAMLACGEDHEARCNTSGVACTWLGIAGETEAGFNGDGKHRLETRIYWPFDMLFAKDGTPWFIDWNNHLVRKVLPDQTVVTVLGTTDPIFPGDGTDGPAEKSADGAPGTSVKLNHPTDLAEAPNGDILVMAWHNHKLRKIDPSTGKVKIVCGAGAGFAGDGGPAEKALFKQPKALQLDGQGNMYIADQQNFRVRKITAAGTIETVAGKGTAGFSGDQGPAKEAQLSFEAGSNPEPSGGLAIANGKLYIADTLANRIRVVDLATNMITTFAGTGEKGSAGDGGPAASAQLNHPRDLEIGPDGDLYVADTDSSKIRAINLTSGTIRTVAGTGELGLDEEDGKLATETKLRRPFGIEFDAAGNLYISDTINGRIVRVAK